MPVTVGLGKMHSQFQRTDCITLKYSFFGVIFFVILGTKFSLN